MAKEKKQLPEDKGIWRRRIYASERLKHLAEEMKSLKTTIVKQKAAPKEQKTAASTPERRAHIYHVMRLQALQDERATLREQLKPGRGSQPQA
jgi:hypothetical protein